MNKLILVLLLISSNFVLAEVFEQEYVCKEEQSIGYEYDWSRGSYKQGFFQNKNFSLTLSQDEKEVWIDLRYPKDYSKYLCEFTYEDIVTCIGTINSTVPYPYMFNLNFKAGFFNRSQAAGNLTTSSKLKDSMKFSFGTCYKD